MKYTKLIVISLLTLFVYYSINEFDARGKEMLNVQVLSIKRCAATPPTIERVQSIATAMGIEIHIEQVIIETNEQANKERFIGSPTVRINGRDIEPSACDTDQFGII